MSSSARRLWAVVAKELRHITRDVRIFLLVTLSPAFLLFVLAYIFAFDVGNVTQGWLDGDRTATARAYLAAITADGTCRMAETVTSYEDLERALLAGRVDIALIVPPGFERQLAHGFKGPATVQALADGTDAILAAQALGNLAARTTAFGAKNLSE